MLPLVSVVVVEMEGGRIVDVVDVAVVILIIIRDAVVVLVVDLVLVKRKAPRQH